MRFRGEIFPLYIRTGLRIIGTRSAQMHETVEVDIETEEPHQVTTDSQDYTTLLINSTKATGGQARMDLRQMMSEKKMIQDRNPKTDDKKKGKIDVSMANISYSVSVHESRGDGALVDRGANGGIAGANLRVIARTDRTVDINGLDNHQVRDLHIVTAGGVITTQRGPVVAIFHQMAHSPMGRTIISSGQMDYFKIKVDDKSIRAGGEQSLRTPDGFVMPLIFRQGLPYLEIRPFSDAEYRELPHAIMTSDVDWDPSVMDEDRDSVAWLRSQPDLCPIHPNFDAVGAYDANRHNISESDTPISVHVDWALLEADSLDADITTNSDVYQVWGTRINPPKRQFDRYAKFFLYSDPAVIKKTFENTTQFARSGWVTGRIWDTHRAPFPALNVLRRNEPVATDTIYSDVTSIDGGAMCAQFFVGCETFVCDIYGIRTDSQFVNHLLDVIRTRGAIDQLISDRAQVEVSERVLDILRHLCIDDWQSEPHNQHQNFAERRYREVKHKTNRVLNMTGAPDNTWLLVMEYVCFILNRMALRSKNWKTPLELLKGQTPDISMIYRHCFWDKVYFVNQDSRNHKYFPSALDERAGGFIGFAESVGHPMTYKILVEDTGRIIFRSRIKSAETGMNCRINPVVEPTVDDAETGANCRINPVVEPTVDDENGRLETVGEDNDDGDLRDDDDDEHRQGYLHMNPYVENEGHDPGVDNTGPFLSEDEDSADPDDETIHFVHPRIPREVVRINERLMATLDPDELIGWSYLTFPAENETRTRLRIAKTLEDLERSAASSPKMKRFRSTNDESTIKEIFSYNELLDRLDDPDGEDSVWRFTSIDAHQGICILQALSIEDRTGTFVSRGRMGRYRQIRSCYLCHLCQTEQSFGTDRLEAIQDDCKAS